MAVFSSKLGLSIASAIEDFIIGTEAWVAD
jgi:hypothetical protein